MVARTYDPAIGRFLQVDRLAEAASNWTPYRFGFNNPLYWSDPLGLFETRKEARQYRRSQRRAARKNGEKYSGGKIVKNKDGRFDVRSKSSDGFVTQKADGNLQFGAVAKSGGSDIAQMGMVPDIDWNKEVGLAESLIPVWGSARMAVRDFNNGNYGWAAFNTVMAISDVFLVKSLVVGVGKVSAGILWKTGSNTWGATRSWLGRTGQAQAGQQVHHWLLHRNQGIGRLVPDRIKNQPWNLIPMPNNPAIHQAIHGGGPLASRQIPYLLWFGTPDYLKGGVMYGLGRPANASRE